MKSLLTPEQRVKILQLAETKISHAAIASRFGVSKTTIDKVVPEERRKKEAACRKFSKDVKGS